MFVIIIHLGKASYLYLRYNKGMSTKEISKRFKKTRKNSGLTQLEVAEKANVSVNYYARIERGEVSPSLETLKDIMKILKIKSLEISTS